MDSPKSDPGQTSIIDVASLSPEDPSFTKGEITLKVQFVLSRDNYSSITDASLSEGPCMFYRQYVRIL